MGHISGFFPILRVSGIGVSKLGRRGNVSFQ